MWRPPNCLPPPPGIVAVPVWTAFQWLCALAGHPYGHGGQWSFGDVHFIPQSPLSAHAPAIVESTERALISQNSSNSSVYILGRIYSAGPIGTVLPFQAWWTSSTGYAADLEPSGEAVTLNPDKQGWVGSRAGGFDAEAETMRVKESRDRSWSRLLPF